MINFFHSFINLSFFIKIVYKTIFYFNLNIPIILKTITIIVEPKIKILLFLAKEPNADVIKDFSVSLRLFHFLMKVSL